MHHTLSKSFHRSVNKQWQSNCDFVNKTVMEAPQPWGLYELTRLVGKTGIYVVSDRS